LVFDLRSEAGKIWDKQQHRAMAGQGAQHGHPPAASLYSAEERSFSFHGSPVSDENANAHRSIFSRRKQPGSPKKVRKPC
jgi:hypothetical protein